jgi:hypothetical protein
VEGLETQLRSNHNQSLIRKIEHFLLKLLTFFSDQVIDSHCSYRPEKQLIKLSAALVSTSTFMIILWKKGHLMKATSIQG